MCSDDSCVPFVPLYCVRDVMLTAVRIMTPYEILSSAQQKYLLQHSFDNVVFTSEAQAYHEHNNDNNGDIHDDSSEKQHGYTNRT